MMSFENISNCTQNPQTDFQKIHRNFMKPLCQCKLLKFCVDYLSNAAKLIN